MNRLSNRHYSIEIVPADRGWILETMAQAIADAAADQPHRFSVRVVDRPTDKADLTFFLPESAYRPLTKSIAVTYLAHKEDHSGAAALFEKVARESDYCVTSSTKYQQVLERHGARKVFKIPLGVDTTLFTPKLRIGVVGRTYGTGRKGEALLAGVLGNPMIELRFTGEGWPYPADYYSTGDLAGFYSDLDYLLIPSLIEGGPVSLLEALSSGCPVIAPTDIGLVEDFPHIPFARGDAEDLQRVMLTLLERKLALRRSVLDCDWKVFASRHLELFTKLIDERRSSQQALTDSPSVPGTNRLRILVVTHGVENVAKGGPSTRVDYIVAQLRADGHLAEACHNIRSAEDLANFDIVHVFNSWPPQTAHQCLAAAKRAGKAVVFSPIALDLADWPIYRELMSHAFASGSQAVAELIAQLPGLSKERRYGADGADVPVEGIPGHFEALRKACDLADFVILLSEHERNFLTALGADVKAGTIIHNGVSDVFSSDADSNLFRERYGLSNYVLCVGRVEYRKNQALLAKAIADIDAPLVLIGDVGDPGYLDHVKKLAGPKLHHIPHIEEKRLLASAYAGAAVFVLPSWSEGAPLSALEAGMIGTPLVLSDRSGEREYFGDTADYVSPTDVPAMRAAVLQVLDRKETQETRSARASFLRARYSEAEHVRKTLALYRSAARSRPLPTACQLVIDVSAHVHTLHVGQHLTGVPFVEASLIDQVVAMHPSAKCITYRDEKKCFVEVDYGDLVSFDRRQFRKKYSAANAGYEGTVDRQLRLTVPDPKQSRDDWASWALVPLRRAGMSRSSLRWVKRRLKWARKRLRKVGLLSKTSEGDGSTSIDFSNVGRYLSEKNVPRQSLRIAPDSRILTLGQGWLSNEPLLDKLVELAAGHSLEAYVYDISYVSGAHYSGWGDNDDRVRRLAKLLRHCQTVYTESTTSRRELAKFGRARGLSYQIVRTKLRGKEPQVAQTAARDPFVLYVSSFNRRKNHDLIVNVWRDLLSTSSEFAALRPRLLLVGEVQGEAKYGDPAYQLQLIRHDIHVVTNASDEKLAELYGRCLFTIYPSLQEGWGIPVQESLQHGRVCLVADSVPAAQEINNAALIRLSPNDFFGWREAILSWATNHTMRAAFEERALQYRPPTWESIARCILDRHEAS